MARLAVNEPPFILAGTRTRPAPGVTDRIAASVAAGDPEAALRVFLLDQVGLPEAALERLTVSPLWPRMLFLAPTAVYDSALAGDAELPTGELAALSMRTLVLYGDASFPWIIETARAVARALPNAELARLEGQPHSPAPAVLAPALDRFFLQ
jgi:pimeloyl-ACP methyl ester carboxylesterase